MKIGYHASHEQFRPGDLLEFTVRAQEAGFQAVLSSDHFHSWSKAQRGGGHAWSWLGAAMQATSLPFGVINAPGYRYHPAVIAQAAATLADMFPGRFWLGLGSGELLNEVIMAERWPSKGERNARLLECVDIIRGLWGGETMTRHGQVRVQDATLHLLPEKRPLIMGAALTEPTARWVAGWADGMITTSRPLQELKQIKDAFLGGGGEGKPMYLKVQVSYAPSREEAMRGAWEQWRTSVLPAEVISELGTQEMFDGAARFITPEHVDDYVLSSPNSCDYVVTLRQYAELGFEHIYVHNVNTEQQRFIDFFSRKVLPGLLKYGAV